MINDTGVDMEKKWVIGISTFNCLLICTIGFVKNEKTSAN